jgi:hypothetical protein
LAILNQSTAIWTEKIIITLVNKKNAEIFTENGEVASHHHNGIQPCQFQASFSVQVKISL